MNRPLISDHCSRRQLAREYRPFLRGMGISIGMSAILWAGVLFGAWLGVQIYRGYMAGNPAFHEVKEKIYAVLSGGSDDR